MATTEARNFPVRTDLTLYSTMAIVNEYMGNYERGATYLCSDIDYSLQAFEDHIARLGKAYYDELCAYYQTQIDETLTYARRMAQCDPLLSEEICQRVGQSAAVCGGLQTFQGLLTVSPVCTFPVCSLKTAHSCDKMAAFSF